MTENCTVYWRERLLERTAHRLRCCSGNMFGTADAVYWYSRLMEEEQQRTSDAERDASGRVLARGWCADQAVHQALLWTGQFADKMKNVTTYQNEDGPLCTMGDVLSISVDDFGDVRNVHGELYALVHQYDRHQRVRDIIAARYAEDDAAADHLHPSFVPGYKEQILYGDLSKVVRHEHVDTSMPSRSPPAPSPPPRSHTPDPLPETHACAGNKSCHARAASPEPAGSRPLPPPPSSPSPPPLGEAAAGETRAGAGDKAASPPHSRDDESLAASRRAEHWRGVIERAPPSEAEHVRALAALALEQPPAYESYPAGRFEGRGVVMAAGGRLQVVNAYSVVRALRARGCRLPVELYYAGASEMSAHVVHVFNEMDVAVLDMYHSLAGEDAQVALRGFQIKAFAVLHSSFEEVLWLDSDSVPASDVSQAFESTAFRQLGSLFWQDWSRDPHWLSAQFLAAYGLHMQHGERELEAGQFVLCKRRCWTALQMVVYMNRHFVHFYRRLYGDKDTWRLAFKVSPVSWPPALPRPLSPQTCQGRRKGHVQRAPLLTCAAIVPACVPGCMRAERGPCADGRHAHGPGTVGGGRAGSR